MRKTLGVAGLGLLGAALGLGAPAALGGGGGGLWGAARGRGARAALGGLAPAPVRAQPPPVPAAPDARFAGLQWTFVRVHYAAWTLPPRAGLSPYDEPWYIDAPAAE